MSDRLMTTSPIPPRTAPPLVRRHSLAVAAVVITGGALLAGCNNGGGAPASSGTSATKGVAASKPHNAPTCPLTGTPATKGALSRPALAVKIDNIPQAMPQAGLNSTDLVIEEQVEGGLTRLFAVFQCHGSDLIGPVRSARTTDVDLLTMLHGPVFAFSGANGPVYAHVQQSSDAALVDWDHTPSLFHVDTARVAPHDVFGSSGTLLRAGEQEHGIKLGPPTAVFRYGAADPAAHKAHSLSMSWPGATAGWTWDGQHWLRTQDGVVDTTTSGQRASATNVVVLAVKLTYNGLHDVLGSPSPDNITTGTGNAWVFRDGSVVKGTWKRDKATDPWTLRDHKGRVINLRPGRTWVELLPNPGSLSIHAH